jgi:hypothetical protein
MKFAAVLVLICCSALSGCDTLFTMQIDVDRANNASLSIDNASSRNVAEAVRLYAANNHLVCKGGEDLPIWCHTPPVQVFAVKTPGGATVCYSALGIPPETASYERRASSLRETLAQRFGADRIFAAPMTHNWSDRCERGAQQIAESAALRR